MLEIPRSRRPNRGLLWRYLRSWRADQTGFDGRRPLVDSRGRCGLKGQGDPDSKRVGCCPKCCPKRIKALTTEPVHEPDGRPANRSWAQTSANMPRLSKRCCAKPANVPSRDYGAPSGAFSTTSRPTSARAILSTMDMARSKWKTPSTVSGISAISLGSRDHMGGFSRR